MWGVFGGGGRKQESEKVAEKSDLSENHNELLLNKIRKSRKFWRTRSGPSPGLVTRGESVKKTSPPKLYSFPPITEKDKSPPATLLRSKNLLPFTDKDNIPVAAPVQFHVVPSLIEKEDEEVDLMEEECSQSPPLIRQGNISRVTLNVSEQLQSKDSQIKVSPVLSQPTPKPDGVSEEAETKESTQGLENTSMPNAVGGILKDNVNIGLEQSSNSDKVVAGQINTLPSITRQDSWEFNRSKMITKILEAENLNIKQLRKYSWRGIPAELRPRAWRHLLGYIPRHRPRAEAVLQRKRAEYQKMVSEYYPKTSYRDPETDPSIPAILADLVTHTEQEAATFRQISIDVPRTHPKLKLFQLNRIKMCLTRILFIWALRHPATSYVQGFNDLCTAFLYLFLDEQTRLLFNRSLWPTDSEVLNLAGTKVPDATLQNVEADAFWCFNALLEQIQDHYIFGQPAIQQMMFHLEEVIRRIDEPLHHHLVKETGISFLHFSFRWMNCLLLREIRLHLILRLWDTYLSIEDASIAQGFTQFHVFVCAAFLRHFSKQLLKCETLESSVLLLQNLPTKDWSENEIEEILSEAYLWKETFGLNIQK